MMKPKVPGMIEEFIGFNLSPGWVSRSKNWLSYINFTEPNKIYNDGISVVNPGGFVVGTRVLE